ncbi:PAS domain S-box protein [Microcoleus sp. FACHB-831]|uniref:PAS domain S-box protein n=1 Tax=Microcoleus sp. FACHB-831 TaxID=2692827 RepID=UPI00168894B1|nr:PAS domain S-box protein [Microcoleus sp. FACHB-831]
MYAIASEPGCDRQSVTMQNNTQIFCISALEPAIDRHPLTVAPDTPLLNAIAQMSQHDRQISNVSIQNAARARCVLVMQETQIVGLLEEGDVVRLVASGMNLANVKIEEVMSQPVRVLKIAETIDISAALSILNQHNLSHLPVLDDTDRLVGIVTHESITKALQPTSEIAQQELLQKSIYQQSISMPNTEARSLETTTERILSTDGIANNIIFATDITPSSQTTEALQSSESVVRSVITNAPIILYSINSEGVFTLSEGKGLESLGLAPGEVVGQSVFDIYRNNTDILEKLVLVLAGKKNEWIGKLGDFVYDNRATSLRNENGQIIGMIGLAIDITQRQRAEEARQESEERFRIMADNAAVLIWMTDRNGRCIFVNKPYLDFTGKTLEELGANWGESIHPEDRHRCLNTYLSASNARQKFTIEYRMRRADGEYCWILDKGIPRFTSSGNFVGYVGSGIDISERKASEEEKLKAIASLQESEQKLSLHVEQTPLAVIEWNLNFEVTKWNLAAQNIFGYSESEAKGRHAYSLIIPQSARDRVGQIWNQLLTKTGGTRSTNENITKLGETIICDWYNTPLRNTEGMVIGVASLAQDITQQVEAQIELQLAYEELEMRVEVRTAEVWQANEQLKNEINERKRTEAELRATTSRLTALITNLQAGILVEDESRQIILVNQAFCTMFGVKAPPNALIGLDCSQSTLEHKYLFVSPEKFVQRMEEIIARRQVITNEEILLTNGRILERDYVPIFVEENYCGHLWMHRDITSRKLAEVALLMTQQRLQYLLSSSPAVIYSCKASEDYGTTFISENVRSVFGYEAREFLEEPNFWRDRVHPEEIDEVMTGLAKLFDEEHHTHEYRFLHKDGTYRWMHDEAKLVRDKAGNLLEIVGYWADITERKQLEEDIRLALAKEKELGELKSQFITTTSHEFRTPLSTILSSAELLEHYRHKWAEEKQLTHLHRIQKSVKHMTQLLNNVLIIGASEAETLKFHPSPLDLTKLCRDIVEEVQLSDNALHSINLTIYQQPSSCHLDKNLLQQILSNLLANAIMYSPKGSTVEFSLRCLNEYAVFEVRDEGIGIPPEDQPRVFESFYRAGNVGNIPGAGLGLAIVKKCVQLHGGEITLESKIGVGTTFTVTLPISY